MQTITLKVNEDVSEKLLWLLNHFTADEIEILDQSNFQNEKAIESLKLISSIQKGLDDIKANRTHPIEQLWEKLDD